MTKLREVDAERRAESDYSADFSEALARGLRIILAFSSDRRQMSLSEVARQVDLPRATARRALYTLTHLGYVETEGKQYRLKPNILELASAYLTSNPVSHVIQPVCEEIAAAMNMTCSVAVLEQGEAVLIARAAPRGSMSVGLGLGFRVPAHSSSLGRVLLAELPNDQLDAFLARLDPKPITPSTLTSKPAIRKAIIAAREQGFAFVDQETEEGFRSVSVPLERYDGTVVAAINLGAQSERMSPEMAVETLVPLLKERSAALRPQLL